MHDGARAGDSPDHAAGPSSDFRGRIDAIEAAYEFFLAYASQGLSSDQGSETGRQAREFLQRCDAALSDLGGSISQYVDQTGLQPADAYRAFIAVIDRDARDAQAAIQLVLAQPSIGSALVDNLNASIHLRALLTDLFLIDEALKTSR